MQTEKTNSEQETELPKPEPIQENNQQDINRWVQAFQDCV